MLPTPILDTVVIKKNNFKSYNFIFIVEKQNFNFLELVVGIFLCGSSASAFYLAESRIGQNGSKLTFKNIKE